MSELPEWIKQRNAANERAAAQANEHAQKVIGDSMLIGRQGPEVWQRFIKGLVLHADALSQLKGENLYGHATLSGPPGAEINCLVNVEWRIASESGPELRRVVFHYDRGQTGRIRVTMQSGEDIFLQFRIQRGGDVVIEYDGQVFSAERLAEKIIQDMVTSTKTPARVAYY